MTFRVVLTANAKANLRHYFERAAAYAPDTAAKWLNRFHAALATLAERPDRCPLARENDLVPVELRQFNFGRRAGAYRVLFSIDTDEVSVLHIRRAAMDTATSDQIMGR